MNLPDSYYDGVRGRLYGILIATSDCLREPEVKAVSDYLDYNELGLALESLTEALAASSDPVSNETIEALRALASEMGMEYDVDSLLGNGDAR